MTLRINICYTPPLSGVLDVCIYEQAVHLRVDVLHGNLETIEAASFSHLNFLAEALHLVVTKWRQIGQTHAQTQ